MLYRKVMVSDRLPNKEGRYIVGISCNKIDTVFQADYSNDLSFYEEFTDCSGIEYWLEPIQGPTDKEVIDQIPKYISTAKKQSFLIGFKKCLELLKGEK